MPQMAPSAWLVLYVMFLVSLLFMFSVVYFTESASGEGSDSGSAKGANSVSWLW